MNTKYLYNKLKTTTINVKGFEMALSTVVIIILVLIVLVVLSSFFIGGAKTTLNPLSEIAKGSSSELTDAFEY